MVCYKFGKLKCEPMPLPNTNCSLPTEKTKMPLRDLSHASMGGYESTHAKWLVV